MFLALLRMLLFFAAVLTPLELLSPARPTQVPWRREWMRDLGWTILGTLMKGAPASGCIWLLTQGWAPIRPAILSQQPYLLQFVEVFFLSELLSYAVHRASHHFEVLWRFHAIHHSSENLDWMSGGRQHPVESLWLTVVSSVPVVLLGFDVEPILLFVLFQKFHTALVHANLRLPSGVWEKVIAGPRFHHRHHDLQDGNCNFASLLPVLDVLAGTWNGETARQTGLTAPLPPGFLSQLLFPFVTPPEQTCQTGQPQSEPVTPCLVGEGSSPR